MKYKIYNATEQHIVEGDTLAEIIAKFVEEDPERKKQSFAWAEVMD